jgi:hypothetical protein
MSRSVLLAFALLAAPALALPPVSVSLGYSAQVFSARSYDLVGGHDHLQQIRVGAGYALPVWRGFLDLELAFATGSTGQVTHNNVPTSFVLRGLEAGAAFRLPMFKHFHPYLLVGAGWDWSTLTVLNDARLTQTVSDLSGRAMLGAQIPFKLGPSYSRAPFLMLDLGLGYVARSGAGFHAMGPSPGYGVQEDPIPHGNTDVGTLPLSGIAYRILVTCRL